MVFRQGPLGVLPHSPDLSPLENFWRTLKQRIKMRRAKNNEELEGCTREKWDKITIASVNKHILTMARRMINALIKKVVSWE